MADQEPPRKKARPSTTESDGRETTAEAVPCLESVVEDPSEDQDDGGDVRTLDKNVEKDKEGENLELFVIFCTAEVPPKAIDLLLQAISEDGDELTFLHVLETTASHQRTEGPTPRKAQAPFSFADHPPRYPFLNWKPAACYEFYNSNLAPSGNPNDPRRFAASTLLILDSTTVAQLAASEPTPSLEKVTYLLCTDGADMPDGEYDPVDLKGRRRQISGAYGDLTEMMMMNCCICELVDDGEEYGVYVYPPESFGEIEGMEADGGLLYSGDTAEEVRAKIRKAKGEEERSGSEAIDGSGDDIDSEDGDDEEEVDEGEEDGGENDPKSGGDGDK